MENQEEIVNTVTSAWPPTTSDAALKTRKPHSSAGAAPATGPPLPPSGKCSAMADLFSDQRCWTERPPGHTWVIC
jgi:hypothetical protein